MADKGKSTPSSAGSGAAVGFDQAEIDALLKSSAGDNAPTTDASSDAQELNQADIDTLQSGLGADAAPREDPSSAPNSNADASGQAFNDVAAEMQAALDAERTDGDSPKSAAFEAKSFDLPDLTNGQGVTVDANRVSMLQDVNLRVRVELGRTKMLVEDVLKLGEGSIVELEKLAGDPVDVYVNDRLLARGEVLVLNDSFCVRVSEVFTPDPHRVVT